MSDLQIVPVSAEDAKHAIAAYSRQANQIIAALYTRFQAFREQYWAGQNLPDIVIAIAPEMHNKKLAHYTPCNGYQIPHAIEFNRNFISLNWDDQQVVEQPDRTLIDHVLIHEIIHLYQDAVLGEKFTNDQAAHGRSFRREARRLGLEGRGRLMACPYPVKMPGAKVKAVRQKEEQEPDDQEEAPRRPAPVVELETSQLLDLVQQRATAQLPANELKLFEKHFQAATALLKGDSAPRRPAKRLTFEEKLDRAIKKCYAGSTEKRLYEGEPVTIQEVEHRAELYRTRAKNNPGSEDSILATWLDMKLKEMQHRAIQALG